MCVFDYWKLVSFFKSGRDLKSGIYLVIFKSGNILNLIMIFIKYCTKSQIYIYILTVPAAASQEQNPLPQGKGFSKAPSVLALQVLLDPLLPT